MLAATPDDVISRRTTAQIRYIQTSSGEETDLADAADGQSNLSLPDIDRARFEKNLIKTAVCELRFPALLEYETKRPVELQRELRKDFPLYDRQQAVSVNSPDKEVRHLLRSRTGEWLVSFRPWSIALETSRYTQFEEFAKKLETVLEKSKSFLDTDFFTRIGLRYINEVHIENGNPDGWIRDELISPLVRGVYGRVDRFLQEVRGTTKSGKYTFRHGIVGTEDDKRDLYTIDFDFYSENVELDAVLRTVSEFNVESFRFFLWAIGPKARERLGKIVPEKG
jgi:uncharacterized protein (TIGR04255 family)